MLREELEGLRLSPAAMNRHKGAVTTLAKSVQRAVVRKFAEIGGSGASYPSEQEWREYMRPESTRLWVEYMCRACGTLCKVFNKYGALIDDHERYGRTTCDLIGRRCVFGTMEGPVHLADVYMQRGRAAPRPSTASASNSVNPAVTTTPASLPHPVPEERGTPLLGSGSYEHLAGEIFEDFPTTGGIAIQRDAEDTGGSDDRMEDGPTGGQEAVVLPPEGGPTPISAFAWTSVDGAATGTAGRDPSQEMEGLRSELLKVTRALEELSKKVERSEGDATPRGANGSRAPLNGVNETLLPPPNTPPSLVPPASSGPFPILSGSHPASVGPVPAEEDWADGLDMSSLQRLAKGTGRVLSGREYSGDPNPTLFSAWCNSIRTLVKVYNVTPGPSQVLAASSFLTGRAWNWWAGVQTSRRYLEMGGLEDFFHAVQM